MTAVIAALIAAGAALIATVANVVTARFTSREARAMELYRWRREALLPSYAALLSASDKHRAASKTPVVSTPELIEQRKHDAQHAMAAMSESTAMVELVASSHVAALAEALRVAHRQVQIQRILDRLEKTREREREPGKKADSEDAERERHAPEQLEGAIEDARTAFLNAARSSLGLSGKE